MSFRNSTAHNGKGIEYISSGKDSVKGNTSSDSGKNDVNEPKSANAVPEENGFGLQRTWDIWACISLNLGSMIGSGIFVSPQGVLRYSGSIGLSLVVWASTGIIVFFAGLCYSELGTMIPKSSGDFIYLKTAYGGGLAFMQGFIAVLVLKPSAQAILSMTCSTYMLALFFNDDCGGPPTLIVKLLAAIIILLTAAFNMASANAGKSVQIVFTIAKLAGLGIIIVGGVVMLTQGHTQNFINSFEGTTSSAASIVLAFYSCQWSYDGWQTILQITEEVKSPHRNIPLSMLVSVLISTVVYVMANASYYTVMTKDQLLASPAVAVTWAESVMPEMVWIMPVVVAFSTFGALNGVVFSGARLTYRISREGHSPSILNMVHVQRLTPLTAILMNAILSVIYIIPSNIQQLLDMLGFMNWTIDGLAFLGIIVMRFTLKDAPRPFKVPIIIPIAMTLLSAFFVLAPLIEEARPEYIYGLTMFIGCLVFYFPFVFFELSIPGIDHVTRALQLFFQVAPSEI